MTNKSSPNVSVRSAILCLFIHTGMLYSAYAFGTGALDEQKLDLLITRDAPLEPYVLSPYVDTDAVPYALPAVRALRERLRIAERVVQGRRLPVRHAFQVLYGSNFLRHNPVGNDLDSLIGVHLGTIRLSPVQPETAAEELLVRMESYLQVIDEVFLRYATPELSVLQPTPLKDRHFRDRDIVLQRLTASLSDVAEARPHELTVVQRQGVRVPTVLPPDESYIFAVTRIQFLSNRVRSISWMFPGIRRIQMMFHFFARLEVAAGPAGESRIIENLPLHPAFVPTGKLLNVEENLLWAVPLDAPSAQFFSEIAFADPERMVDLRLDLARQLLGEVDHKIEVGETVKALKRLRQAQEALAPALPPDSVAELGREVAAALNDPDVLLCQQVAEMATMSRHVFRDPALLTLFRDSGDLQRTLRRIAEDVGVILLRQPELRSTETSAFDEQLQTLIALLDAESYATSADEADDLLDDIKDWGETSANLLGPSAEDIAPRLETAREFLHAAGIHPLHVYGLSDDTVGVLPEDLDRLGMKGDPSTSIVAGGGPPFDYRTISAEELPRSENGEPLPASYRLWVSLERSDQEKERGRALKSALSADFARFTPLGPSSSPAIWQTARKDFHKEFGTIGAEAWDISTTRGAALLALLSAERTQARELLGAHLKLTQRSSEAAAVMPTLANGDDGFQIALERALWRISERILEGLAVSRMSDGRRGLDPFRARRAQQQLSQLIAALSDLAHNRATIVDSPESRQGAQLYRIRTQTEAAMITLLVRPRAIGERAPASIEIRIVEIEGKPALESLVLVLALHPTGGTYELRFSSDRIDWGVHGSLPTDPFVPDRFFFDGMPAQFQSPSGPLARENMAPAFARYIEERFLPDVIEDLPSVP